MIARLWRGVVDVERMQDYAAYVRDTGVAEYRRTPGNRAAYILIRRLDERTGEVTAFSVWRDVAAVRAFAGEDIEAMVLYPEDEQYLLEPPSLVHFDVNDPGGSALEPRSVAEAFSSHRFAEAYPFLADDVEWVLVGGSTVRGQEAVRALCERTSVELDGTRVDFTRFVSVADAASAVVDAVGRYTDAEGAVSVVSSCDLYEFDDAALRRITSYTVELDRADGGDP
jgi:ketosteroid isomerase-like protein